MSWDKNPWAKSGTLYPDWSNSDATTTPAISNFWIGLEGILPESAKEMLDKSGISIWCAQSCLAKHSGAKDALEYFWGNQHAEGQSSSVYAALDICSRVAFVEVIICLARCGGYDLAADFLDYWMHRKANTLKSAVDTITLDTANGQVEAKDIHFLSVPFKASLRAKPEIWNPIRDTLGKNSGTYGQVIAGACARLRNKSKAFPENASSFMKDLAKTAVGQGLYVSPGRNRLALDGAEHLFTERVVPYNTSYPPATDVLATGDMTIFSDVEVIAQRARYFPTTRTIELIHDGDTEDVNNVYGYHIRIENWRIRIWDWFNFDPSKSFTDPIFGFSIQDEFFLPFTLPQYGGCKNYNNSQMAIDYFVMSDDWIDISTTDENLYSDLFFSDKYDAPDMADPLLVVNTVVNGIVQPNGQGDFPSK